MYKQCLPAGYSDSDDDSFDGKFYKTAEKKQPIVHVKTGIELKKEKLLEFLMSKDLNAIKNELDHGEVKRFNIDEELNGSWNLLFLACSIGCSEIVQYLVEERGAFVNKTINSESPLMVACYSTADSKEVLKIVKTLVNQNATFKLSNMYGVTPLMFASSLGHIEVVEYLLSINDDIDAIDNEGMNSLFHAIDGKQVEIARILIEAGIDLNIVNKYGIAAREYASNELQEDIVELFPPIAYKYRPPCNFLSYNSFEDIIPGMGSDVPLYFPDVVTLLRGMNCEEFIDLFALAKVNLEEFLTITDERLKEVGLELPFQRNMIKVGLFKFYNEAWSRSSLFVSDTFEDGLSDLDLIMILANTHRQLVVIKSHFHHIIQLGSPQDIKSVFDYFSLKYLIDFESHTKHLEKMLIEKIRQNPQSRPLLIKKKTKTFPSLMKVAAFAVIPIVIVIAIKRFKN